MSKMTTICCQCGVQGVQSIKTHFSDTRDHADDHTGSVVRCLRFEERVWPNDVSQANANEDDSGGDLA